MAATHIRTPKMHQTLWMAGGLLCLGLAFAAWLLTDTQQLLEVETQPVTDVVTNIQPEKVAATTHLGALLNEVRPLEMTTRVVATGQHEAEFRGNKFIDENKNKYVIELFRTTKEDIVTMFLKKQVERKNYKYIRLSGDNQIEQYAVLYGVYNTQSEAQHQLSQLGVELPKSVQPLVTGVKSYKTLVNDLGSDELGLNQKIYDVKLRPSAIPKAGDNIVPVTPTAKRNVAPVANDTEPSRHQIERRQSSAEQTASSVVKRKPTPVVQHREESQRSNIEKQTTSNNSSAPPIKQTPKPTTIVASNKNNVDKNNSVTKSTNTEKNNTSAAKPSSRPRNNDVPSSTTERTNNSSTNSTPTVRHDQYGNVIQAEKTNSNTAQQANESAQTQ